MRTKKQNQQVVFGILVLVMGGVFAALGLAADKQNRDMKQKGILVSGKIIEGRVEKHSDGERHILTVQWGSGDQLQTRKFLAKKEYYHSRVDAEGRVVASEISMRQIPGQPAGARMEGGEGAFFAGWQWGGFIAMVMGFVMFYQGARSRTVLP